MCKNRYRTPEKCNFLEQIGHKLPQADSRSSRLSWGLTRFLACWETCKVRPHRQTCRSCSSCGLRSTFFDRRLSAVSVSHGLGSRSRAWSHARIMCARDLWVIRKRGTISARLHKWTRSVRSTHGDSSAFVREGLARFALSSRLAWLDLRMLTPHIPLPKNALETLSLQGGWGYLIANSGHIPEPLCC